MKSNLALALAAALFAGSVHAATDVVWAAADMSRSGHSVSTNGTLVWAICQAASGVTNTVNTVPFVGFPNNDPHTESFSFGDQANTWFVFNDTNHAPSDVEGAYSNLLAHGWWARIDETDWESDFTLRLSKLTPGTTYRVQLILANWDTSRPDSPGNTMASAGGASARADWSYGGTLVGTFTAQSATESFVVTYNNGNPFFNAIQLREIATGGQAPVDPSIGSVSAATARRTATVSLSGVVKGTDIDCNPASYYTVSYRLTKGADVFPKVDLPAHQTGPSASFSIPNLDEGDYVCEVTIATDKEKTASATVSFTILPAGDFERLKAAIEGASDGATIQVAKGYYAATSQINATAAGLTVVSAGGKDVAILDGGSTNRLLYVSGARFKVEGITFKNGHYAGNGGAICYSSSSVSQTTVVKDCDFIDCTAKYGGAIYAGQNSYSSFEPRANYGIVDGCTFLRCGIDSTGTGDRQGGGGGICGALWVENSVFDACFCTTHGVQEYHLAIDVPSFTTVSNCVFRNHTDITRGLVGSKEQREQQGCARLVDCLVADNTSNGSDDVLFHRKVILDRCVISNNATTLTSALTGLYRLDANGDRDFSRITSCLFIDNRYPFDAASMPPLYNCTFIRNVGGLACNYGATARPAVTNCVFWGNLPKTDWPYGAAFKGAPGLYWHGGVDMAGLVRIGNTVIESGSANADIAAVLDADASGASARLTALADAHDGKGIRFANAAKDDWRPQAKSPLTNGGVPCGWMAGARDLAGRPRVFNGAPDVGCYEHFGDPPTLLILK